MRIETSRPVRDDLVGRRRYGIRQSGQPDQHAALTSERISEYDLNRSPDAKSMAAKKARKKKTAAKRRAWNKGLELGKRDAFTPDQVKRIRSLLVKRGVSGLRDLALFSTG